MRGVARAGRVYLRLSQRTRLWTDCRLATVSRLPAALNIFSYLDPAQPTLTWCLYYIITTTEGGGDILWVVQV